MATSEHSPKSLGLNSTPRNVLKQNPGHYVLLSVDNSVCISKAVIPNWGCGWSCPPGVTGPPLGHLQLSPLRNLLACSGCWHAHIHTPHRYSYTQKCSYTHTQNLIHTHIYTHRCSHRDAHTQTDTHIYNTHTHTMYKLTPLQASLSPDPYLPPGGHTSPG